MNLRTWGRGANSAVAEARIQNVGFLRLSAANSECPLSEAFPDDDRFIMDVALREEGNGRVTLLATSAVVPPGSRR